MAFEWTEINYMQVDAAKNIWNNLIFPLAVVFVFLQGLGSNNGFTYGYSVVPAEILGHVDIVAPPNALSPVIVLASLMVATAILLESSLAFLGLGDPNLISWGYMVGAGRTVIRQAWWITVFPGVAILISVLGLNLIGEGLNDALNPRLSREGR